MKKNYCSYYTIVMKKKENNLNSQIFDEIKKGIREDRVPTK